LFAIFVGTVGLALVPPTRLPVVLSVLFSMEENGKTSDSTEKEVKPEKLLIKRDSFETPGVVSEPDRRYPFVGNGFQESPAQIVQASPVPPIGSASPMDALARPVKPSREGHPVTAEPTFPQGLSSALAAGTSRNSPANESDGPIANVGRPPWQSATGGGFHGGVSPADTRTPASVPTLDSPYASAEVSPQTERPNRQQLPSMEGIEHLEELARQFRALGAVRYRLERWGTDGQLFRFTCEMPVNGVSHMTRLWEAIAPSPEEAMRRVLAQISGGSSDAVPPSSRGF
ncbi:MAG: hypothetical protein H5U08_13965, partial [Thermogutta sp.]|uniref:hypothetical protein n=1 Tax=Thermogutta sp. TaxID=1962930 RepID=UPI00198CC725